jgi:pimeloyl-ACP methyl ester carboxylesterase
MIPRAEPGMNPDPGRCIEVNGVSLSAAWVAGPWRYAEIAGASHWVPRDAPAQLNDLLLDWLR